MSAVDVYSTPRSTFFVAALWPSGGSLLLLDALGVLQEGAVREEDVAVERRRRADEAGIRHAVLAVRLHAVLLRSRGDAPRLVGVHVEIVAPSVLPGEGLDVGRGEERLQIGQGDCDRREAGRQ